MLILGPLGFTAPWLLLALAALPVLWVILRALPPAPKLLRFPGTRLLAGLKDPHPVAQRTPWWLLILRLAALAALILAFAGPLWKPRPDAAGTGPLLVMVDGGWAAAPGWSEVQTRAAREFDRAASAGRAAALILADGRTEDIVPFAAGDALAARIRAAQPQPWATRYPPDPEAALAAVPQGQLRTLWLSDGLDHPGREIWLEALRKRGPVTVVMPEAPVQSLALAPGDQPVLTHRATATGPAPVIRAVGPDPQGVLRELAVLTPGEPVTEAGVTRRLVPVDLPAELRNRIQRFEIEGQPAAGTVVLADDRIRRRKVALVGDDRASEGQELLSPLHYLREAIAPNSDLIEGSLAEVLQAAPDVVILVDQTGLPGMAGLADWVEQGGLLIRFAGPRMAASDRLAEEELLPVRLRPGGRDIGGALSWGEPRRLAAFDSTGPFAGLSAPEDVTIRAQLLPEPAPDLQSLTLVQLSDRTPLVTRERLGEGQVVLFHTTANAEWSNLPLSLLFPQMLDRLIQSARSSQTSGESDAAEQPFWTAQSLLDGFGRAMPAGDLAPVAAGDFAQGPSPIAPAGIYAAGERRAALNAGGELIPARWDGVTVETRDIAPGVDLKGWLLALAALLLVLDALASAMLSRGRKAAA
ncbi:BatA domain-containing protein [Paracoccus aminophilus]|uniref:Aerotolerance regulator N-terminal domain-containing protein n=1 Tax=Paracoccus aminophilus JCM 7686 TaxID=1367847 RepID=S5XXL2_PARAH|nr:BatA domain-containing protein [Paracoccus aminophilus]AGT08175.1 hypothetical protein JCM7686_1066 [Paracoccus aminophilus JCM 7686]